MRENIHKEIPIAISENVQNWGLYGRLYKNHVFMNVLFDLFDNSLNSELLWHVKTTSRPWAMEVSNSADPQGSVSPLNPVSPDTMHKLR